MGESQRADDPRAAFAVRLATAADAGLLAGHRVGMFVDMGRLADGDAARRIASGSARLIAAAIAAGDWTAWIAQDATGVLGSGAALLRRLTPRPEQPDGGTEAYLLNFYTEPAARRRGVATAVMKECLAWCAARGIARITLHASDAGRLVYAPLGFVPRTGEMVWEPPPR